MTAALDRTGELRSSGGCRADHVVDWLVNIVSPPRHTSKRPTFGNERPIGLRRRSGGGPSEYELHGDRPLTHRCHRPCRPARKEPFSLPDRNKRAAWVSLRVFIEIIEWSWSARPETEAAEGAVVAVASGDWTEEVMAGWPRGQFSAGPG